MKAKYFFRHTRVERIHHQQICTIRNVKEGSSGIRKMPDGNLKLHKGMRHSENDNYRANKKTFFLLLKLLEKIIDYLKQN